MDNVGYYAYISQEILRDYLVFFFAIFVVAIVIGLYISIKNYTLTRRIENRMRNLHKAGGENLIKELAKLEDLSKTEDFETFFGPLAKVLDLYAVSITDEAGDIVYVNELLCKLTGYESGELLGQPHRILNSQYHSITFWRDMYKQIHGGRLWHETIRNKCKDGSFLWADTTIIPLSMFSHMKGFIALRTDVTHVFAARESIKDELKRKTAQIKDTEKLLEKTDRMATLGELVAGIAHEINNPLSYVSSNIFSMASYMKSSAELIEQICSIEDKEEDAREHIHALKRKIKSSKMDIAAKDAEAIIDETSGGLRQIRDIVHDLKLYSHSRQETYVKTNINECIKKVVNIAKPELKHRIRVSLDLGALPDTYCIDSKIQQVMLNLVINAAQAIKDKGVVTITTTPQEENLIKISVTDNGSGIPADHLEKIFQAFFTTKPPGEGTGLGLTISSNIIRMHGGSIACNSEPGRGTEFVILLPVLTSQPDVQLKSVAKTG